MSELVLIWMISYLLHSSILLSITYLIDRLGFLKNINNAEMVWRFVVLAGLLTASLQTQYYVKNVEQSAITLPLTLVDKVDASVKGAPVKMDAKILQPEINLSKSFNETSIASKQNVLKPREEKLNQNIDSLYSFYSIPSISIPQKLMNLSAYIVGLWLFIALVLWIKTIYGIWYLNRITQSLPVLEKVEFENYLKQYKGQTFQLRLSDRWMSPLVAPNSFICIPSWVFEKLSPEQRIAMLAHEAAHVVRNDPIWRIAMQLCKELFFFQPLNIVAQRKLTLFSELACDQIAMRASSQHQLVHSLYACAKIVKNHEISPLALAMASPSSLYVRISTLLNEGNMKNYFVPKSSSNIIGKLMLLSCTMSLTVFAMPSIVVNTNITKENSIPLKSKTLEILNNSMVGYDVVQKSDENLQANVVQSDLPEESPKNVSNQQFIEAVASTNLLSSESNSATKFSAQNGSSQESQATTSFTINQAKQYFDSKEYAKALVVLNSLVKENDVDAQVMLGEMTWYGEGIESNQIAAESLFKKAASRGNVKAQKFLELFAEREKRQAEIKYYTMEFDGSKYAVNGNECNAVLPDFNTPSSNRIEFIAATKKVKEWGECYNKSVDRLNTLFRDKNIVPKDLIRIMTANELQKIENRIEGVFRNLEAKNKLVANEFGTKLDKWAVDSMNKFNYRRESFLDEDLTYVFNSKYLESQQAKYSRDPKQPIERVVTK